MSRALKRVAVAVFLMVLFFPGNGTAQSMEIRDNEINGVWHYTLFASVFKTAPGVGARFSRSIAAGKRVELDIAYASGTNKGKNFSIETQTLNLAYDFIKSKKISWYLSAGAGVTFLELQNESINVSRESAFAYSVGTGWNYNLRESLVFVLDHKEGWVNPVIQRILFNFDIRSIATSSDLPFAGGATFGRISIGLSMGL